MKLIVGLGNPGATYDRTRHNIGFDVIDALRSVCAPGVPWKARFKAVTCETRVGMPDASHRITDTLSGPSERVLLMKPTTFMNLSGQAVGEAVRFYKLDPEEDVLVIVDDIALPCGSYRVRGKGGAGGHNGLASIEQLLGTAAYPRLRIGVDAPGAVPQVDYVLGKFSPDQREHVDRAMAVLPGLCAYWSHEGTDAAMNAFNALGGPAKPKKQRDDRQQSDTSQDAATEGGGSKLESDASGVSGRAEGPCEKVSCGHEEPAPTDSGSSMGGEA